MFFLVLTTCCLTRKRRAVQPMKKPPGVNQEAVPAGAVWRSPLRQKEVGGRLGLHDVAILPVATSEGKAQVSLSRTSLQTMKRLIKISVFLVALGALAWYLYQRAQESREHQTVGLREFPEIPRSKKAA